MLRGLWVHERIPLKTALDMTWPEIMFYLGAKLDPEQRKIEDKTKQVMESAMMLSGATGRTRIPLHELV